LVATDAKLNTVQFASSNALDHLGVAAEDLIGAPINSILSDEQAHQARNTLGHATIQSQREVIGEKVCGDRRYQISIHKRDDRAILEFLPVPTSLPGEPNALEKTRALLARIVCEPDMAKLLEGAVECLKVQTGYDRVKAYRFLPDGSGEVVAEARSSDMDSFLGLRFPATDIPPVARRLYVNTPIRVISDLDQPDIAVLGSAEDDRPLDMSIAVLRGTASVHTQYLHNMGVKSTMTLPIVVEGDLWGLFSFHHMTPRVPDPTMLIGAELSGKMLSVVIQHATQLKHQGHLGICAAIADDLIVADRKLSIQNYWEHQRDRLIKVLPSDGIAYVVGDQVETVGSAPDAESCLAVRDLALRDDRGLVSYDNLPQRLPAMKLDDVAGALVMPLWSSPQTTLILFRNLVSRTINWAGAPQKELVEGENGYELTPRNSFAKYSETAREMSEEWTNNDLEVATVLWKSLAQNFAVREVSEDKRRLDLLVKELNHRVRNILALVQSLSRKTLGSASSIEDYATALEDRIVALASAHDLLTRAEMRGVRLDQLATIELKPYLHDDRDVAAISGPEVTLNADVSPIFALVLHELTSNAVKYGALSTPNGMVNLTWALVEDGLEINWVERDGPPVSAPTREGFGRSIIESAIPYEFGGEAEMKFDRAGLTARFFLPNGEFKIRRQEKMHPDAGSDISEGQGSEGSRSGRCLVVEDNFVIAREMQRCLRSCGFEEVLAISNVPNALKRIDEYQFSFCLLDINLRGEMSSPVAERLTELGIPFAFASGYGSEGRTMGNGYDAPFLTKPVQLSELRDLLKTMGFEQ
jgi:light-regulated signal transduction histidine kinase (bacteriophytochrome)